MIELAKQGSPVDWQQLPSVSLLPGKDVPTNPPVSSAKQENLFPSVIPQDIQTIAVDVPNEPAQPVLEAPTIPVPRSTLEALEQRLAKYQSTMQQAQEEGNSSKVRRLGRIVKQYQDAIKLNKLGKPVPFDELPDPPGNMLSIKIITISVNLIASFLKVFLLSLELLKRSKSWNKHLHLLTVNLP